MLLLEEVRGGKRDVRPTFGDDIAIMGLVGSRILLGCVSTQSFPGIPFNTSDEQSSMKLQTVLILQLNINGDANVPCVERTSLGYTNLLLLRPCLFFSLRTFVWEKWCVGTPPYPGKV